MTALTLVVDRIEEDKAVLVTRDGQEGVLICPLSFLPPGVKESDVVRAAFAVDKAAAAQALSEAQDLIEQLLRGQ